MRRNLSSASNFLTLLPNWSKFDQRSSTLDPQTPSAASRKPSVVIDAVVVIDHAGYHDQGGPEAAERQFLTKCLRSRSA